MMSTNTNPTNKPVLESIEDLFKVIDEKYVPEKISSGVELYSGRTDAPSFRYGFNLAKRMVIETATPQLLTLFNNMCDERVANYREALSLYGAPQCYHLHHPRKYQHKLGNCPVENRINQLTKDNLLKGGAS